ncbi:hypothetical protein LTS18_013420, partial [Coniosporium uncinatum]
EVLEGVGLLRERQRGLEVFARHLVEGWWSWGDEVLKFSWDGCWRKGCEGEAHGREEGAEKEGAEKEDAEKEGAEKEGAEKESAEKENGDEQKLEICRL